MTCSPRAMLSAPRLGQVAGERLDQGVAAAPVDQPRAAHVAVDLPALEQDRERELLQHRRAAVVVGLLEADGVGRAPGARPASPSAGPAREGLARSTRGRPRAPGRAPAAHRRAHGRSGTRRRSRPRARRRRAPAPTRSAPARRAGLSTTPVGNWCAGVTSTARVRSPSPGDVEAVATRRAPAPARGRSRRDLHANRPVPGSFIAIRRPALRPAARGSTSASPGPRRRR